MRSTTGHDFPKVVVRQRGRGLGLERQVTGEVGFGDVDAQRTLIGIEQARTERKEISVMGAIARVDHEVLPAQRVAPRCRRCARDEAG
jgi:hypothetical protein